MNRFQITKDTNGVASYGINFAEVGSIINLSASTNTTLAVPAGANVALFQIQPGATVLISPTSAPGAPSGSFSASTSDINPALRCVNGVSTLYFYAVDAAIIKVSFYQEP